MCANEHYLDDPRMQFKRKITNIIKILKGLKKTKRNTSMNLKRINAPVMLKKKPTNVRLIEMMETIQDLEKEFNT